jgi:hypothetical protein
MPKDFAGTIVTACRRNSLLAPSTKDTAGEIGENALAFKQINGPWYLYLSA